MVDCRRHCSQPPASPTLQTQIGHCDIVDRGAGFVICFLPGSSYSVPVQHDRTSPQAGGIVRKTFSETSDTNASSIDLDGVRRSGGRPMQKNAAEAATQKTSQLFSAAAAITFELSGALSASDVWRRRRPDGARRSRREIWTETIEGGGREREKDRETAGRLFTRLHASGSLHFRPRPCFFLPSTGNRVQLCSSYQKIPHN